MSQKVYERITNLITEKMEAGTIPWKKSWAESDVKLGQHKNSNTGKNYRGINALLTHLGAYDSPEWLTFKQVRDRGGNVMKGEKGTPIIYWNWVKKEKVNNKGEAVQDLLPILKYYTVFNLEQTEGLDYEKREAKEKIKFNSIEEAEKILTLYSDAPKVVHQRQRAFYHPGEDFINMPKKNTFGNAEEYYSTLFHELAHSTGHESRLNRKTLNDFVSFGDHSYSKEELVAEITSSFLCAKAGISPQVIDNQAAYIKGWLEKLRSNPKFFVEAAQKAQKAADYMILKDSKNSKEKMAA